jgi:hypothetical protein
MLAHLEKENGTNSPQFSLINCGKENLRDQKEGLHAHYSTGEDREGRGEKGIHKVIKINERGVQ